MGRIEIARVDFRNFAIWVFSVHEFLPKKPHCPFLKKSGCQTDGETLHVHCWVLQRTLSRAEWWLMMMEKRTVPKRLNERSLLSLFAMGLSAPALFAYAPTVELYALRRGETLDHAWNSVGSHLSRGMRRVSDERRNRRGRTA